MTEVSPINGKTLERLKERHLFLIYEVGFIFIRSMVFIVLTGEADDFLLSARNLPTLQSIQ